jgi:hypothetical protein
MKAERTKSYKEEWKLENGMDVQEGLYTLS